MEIAGHSKADRAGKTPGLNLIAADFQAGIQPGQKQGRPCQGCSQKERMGFLRHKSTSLFLYEKILLVL